MKSLKGDASLGDQVQTIIVSLDVLPVHLCRVTAAVIASAVKLIYIFPCGSGHRSKLVGKHVPNTQMFLNTELWTYYSIKHL